MASAGWPSAAAALTISSMRVGAVDDGKFGVQAQVNEGHGSHSRERSPHLRADSSRAPGSIARGAANCRSTLTLAPYPNFR